MYPIMRDRGRQLESAEAFSMAVISRLASEATPTPLLLITMLIPEEKSLGKSLELRGGARNL